VACGVVAAFIPVADARAAATGASGATGATGSTGSTGTTAPAVTNPSVSLNWAGYAISGSSGVVRHFKRVTGSWVEPTVTCTPGSPTYSAFWVGLGGLSASSHALEQTGTEADCGTAGVAHYTAWYELVPSAPVTLALTVSPGDVISAAVSVAGKEVTVELTDETSGRSVSRRLHFADPDTTSAEWIAEAPSACNEGGSCTALPLSDFGAVQFSDASVRTALGVTGTISNRRWKADPLALEEISRSGYGPQVFAAATQVVATPTILENAGSSFGVSWSQTTPTATGGSGGRQFPGSGA
jgi:hypothetical protein